jgi:hypothetical protein
MYNAHLSRFEDIDRLGRKAQSAEGVDPKEQKNRMQQLAAQILEIVWYDGSYKRHPVLILPLVPHRRQVPQPPIGRYRLLIVHWRRWRQQR